MTVVYTRICSVVKQKNSAILAAVEKLAPIDAEPLEADLVARLTSAIHTWVLSVVPLKISVSELKTTLCRSRGRS